jgi:hypothetical protein
MTIIINRRHFLEAANAHVKAIQPTPQLRRRLAETYCQMEADQQGGKVTVLLPDGVVISRGPHADQARK